VTVDPPAAGSHEQLVGDVIEYGTRQDLVVGDELRPRSSRQRGRPLENTRNLVNAAVIGAHIQGVGMVVNPDEDRMSVVVLEIVNEIIAPGVAPTAGTTGDMAELPRGVGGTVRTCRMVR